MRILQISSAKIFSGPERHFVDLCRELTQRGHDVFVALRPTNEWQSRLDFLPPENFLHTSIRNSFGMFSSKRIAGFADKNAIDILHAHVARDYVAASIACRTASRVKLVLTRHVRFPMKSFHRLALRNVDAAIAGSPIARLQLEKIFPAEKVHVIPNGIATCKRDRDAARRAGAQFRALHDIPDEVPLVVTVGELKIAKGQRDFVLAANEIVKSFPDCRFVIAGQDNSMDKGFRRELKRLVKVLGLDKNVLWLSWLDDVASLFDAADVVVSPAHSGGFRLTILEAMASGCAVVAAETEGARLLIDDPGLLAPAKDPLALAERICTLLGDSDHRLEIGEKLQASAGENYGFAQVTDAIENIYQKILVK